MKNKILVTCIIHFAAYKVVFEMVQFPLNYYHHNIFSTVNLLQLIQEKQVSYLAFSSSCTVNLLPSILFITKAASVVPAKNSTCDMHPVVQAMWNKFGQILQRQSNYLAAKLNLVWSKLRPIYGNGNKN
jgi:UDP-glucose 4-epimerase